MKYIALLRGVTPTGKNKIPKMSYLVEVLEDFIDSQELEIESYDEDLVRKFWIRLWFKMIN